jgi:hypothetical protein
LEALLADLREQMRTLLQEMVAEQRELLAAAVAVSLAAPVRRIAFLLWYPDNRISRAFLEQSKDASRAGNTPA